MGLETLGTSQVFVVRVSRKGPVIEGSECGCLSHATLVERFGMALWVALINACLEKRGVEVLG